MDANSTQQPPTLFNCCNTPLDNLGDVHMDEDAGSQQQPQQQLNNTNAAEILHSQDDDTFNAPDHPRPLPSQNFDTDPSAPDY
ncbi:hypothetical protein BGZ97_009682, partial [Linnemannia gamsii]